ncbi:uncharacterized protein YjbI with pentapeptide repeats [Kibdelosporangium banguiense]|uniref:Uncharacterized protein YjbI with pentapeptide repeats n=1 Tax=Kibdelosporangium banguiense TaxID=1365924 RepID=A0ABS4TWJ9_9PSEU|nr:hypothetical protein [Kibdelosporangium banguiense]MBP2328340.1 uncharacterized protein YjbI with pentapeptide repeats [Kibdelosporangium banguiense]
MLDDLTDQEQSLVTAARDGTVLAFGEEPDSAVRAGLIRELLLGRRGELDPRGVRISGARITGALELDYVTAAAGLDLVDCVLDERADLTRAVLPRLTLSGSRIAGIQAHGLQVNGHVDLSGARVSGAGEDGAICLRGARINGSLDLSDSVVRNDSGPALHVSSLRMDESLVFRRARMTGTGDRGTIRLTGADVRGVLIADDAELSNDTGPGMDAADLKIGGNAFLVRARLSGSGAKGAVRLQRAHIGGVLDLTDAELISGAGPALHADGLHVADTILLLDARISGTGDGGAARLLGAHVGGLRVVNTLVCNDSGPALFADQLQAGGLVHLERVRMSGAGDHATVRMAAATIGRLTLIDSTIENPAGALLDLHTTNVAGSAHLPTGTICREVHCEQSTVNLNDFAYGSLPHVQWRQWLHVIRCHTKEYRPSPYQRLAAVERAAGHDGNARHILITQQHDLRHRAPAAVGGWLTRRFHWLWGALAGYGYRARRTALALLVALATAGLISFWAGHIPTGPGRYAAEHTTTASAPRTPCSTVELVGLGLDRGLPLGPTGLRTRCDLDTESPAGQVFTVLLWIVQAAVWGLATLAIAGYTGLIRKTA